MIHLRKSALPWRVCFHSREAATRFRACRPYSQSFAEPIARASASRVSWNQIALAGGSFLFAGFIGGATGVGHGILSITALAQLPGLRYTQLQAVGSAASPFALCSFSSGLMWLRDGLCDIPVAVCLGSTGLLGVVIGVSFATNVPDTILKLAFAGVLCFVMAPISIHSAFFKEVQTSEESSKPLHVCDSLNDAILACRLFWQDHQATAIRHCTVGLLVGILTGAFAIGDTPVLIAYLSAFGYTQKEAIGTAIVTTIPTMAYAAGLHFVRGSGIAALVPVLSIAMFAGGAIGAKVSSSALTDEQLQLLFSFFVFSIGIVTGWDAWRSLQAS